VCLCACACACVCVCMCVCVCVWRRLLLYTHTYTYTWFLLGEFPDRDNQQDIGFFCERDMAHRQKDRPLLQKRPDTLGSLLHIYMHIYIYIRTRIYIHTHTLAHTNTNTYTWDFWANCRVSSGNNPIPYAPFGKEAHDIGFFSKKTSSLGTCRMLPSKKITLTTHIYRYRFKLNKSFHLNLYREIPQNGVFGRCEFKRVRGLRQVWARSGECVAVCCRVLQSVAECCRVL